MRIALVVGSMTRRGGGVSVAVEALSRNLMAADHDVAVFTLRDDAWESDAGGWTGAPAIALPIRGPRTLAYAAELAPRLIAFNPDLVHVHGIWSHLSRSVLQWHRKTGKPYVVSPHGMLNGPALQHSPLKKRIASWWYEAQHLQGAACLHALSESEAEAIRAYGLTAPIAIVPNGTDPAPSRPSGERAPWQDNANLPGPVMLFLGRFHPIKNLSVLVEAWASAVGRAGQSTPWSLVLAGWGDEQYRNELRSAASRIGPNGRISFVGPLFGDAKDAALRAADAFILPSLSEGSPMAVLEAWSYGLPVLMTETCNIPEGFSAGAARKLALDVTQMAEDLRSFFEISPLELNRMGQSARQLAEERFSWKRIAADLADTYRFLIEEGCGVAPPVMKTGIHQ